MVVIEVEIVPTQPTSGSGGVSAGHSVNGITRARPKEGRTWAPGLNGAVFPLASRFIEPAEVDEYLRDKA